VVSAPDIPGHKVAGVLGTGGFSTVYRAWQMAVGREVAVKIDNRVLLTERDRRRFVREVTAAGRLSGHPHVIDVYDAGTLADGRPYLVMELCPAGSLNDLLHRRGPLSPAQVCDIGIRISDALAAAHGAGILHRDIKPANILINRYGMVGLADFGLAAIMAAGGEQSASRDALTPAYASPESFRSEEPTVAADVYSLAATLYALLCGRPPRFPAGPTQPGIATIMDLHGQPVDDIPGVPPALMAVLRDALAADPAQRPPAAVALRDSLAALPARPRPPAPGGAAGGPPAGGGAGPAATLPAGDGQGTTHPGPAVGWAGLGGGDPEGTEPVRGHRAGSRRAAPPGRGTPLHGPQQGSSRQGTRRSGAMAGAIALMVVVIAGAVVSGARFFWHGPAAGPGTGPSHSASAPVPGVFGVPTTTTDCPAAAVHAAAAQCTRAPECWAGLVEISGSVSARPLPCGRGHVWQTFAIGILPASVRTFDQDIVQGNSMVKAVCSASVLLRSRTPPARHIPPKKWTIQVLPPDEAEYGNGARAYRCVATVIGDLNMHGSHFGH
jgi:hypothetical protein